MICRGKIIEIQSSELSPKHGLIAKCMIINGLLKGANLDDKSLSTDPAFLPEESKAIIKFNEIKGKFLKIKIKKKKNSLLVSQMPINL